MMKNLFSKVYLNYKLLNSKRTYNNQINEYIKNNNIILSDFDNNLIRKYKKKWSVFDKYVSTKYLIAYSKIYGVEDIDYIPDYIYRFPVEKILLNRRYSICHEDKNIYDQINGGVFKELFPYTYLRNIEGVYYDNEYNHVSEVSKFVSKLTDCRIIFKESIDTSSGKGVRFFKRNSGKSDNYFDEDYGNELISFMNNKRNFLIQREVKQNKFMREFNESSVNTVRIVTYRSVKDESVHVLQALVKRGGMGNKVDNLNSGGSFVEIKNNGLIASHGIDMHGNKITVFLDNYTFPWYDEVVKIAKYIASCDYYHRQLFYDFYIDENGKVKIMEINHSAHPPIQAVCGPAFGEYTDEVIEFCLNNLKYMSVAMGIFRK